LFVSTLVITDLLCYVKDYGVRSR